MQNYYRFVNEPLPYSFAALEPYIDTETMYLHHDKHLQTYIDKLNQTMKDNPSLQIYSLEELLHNVEDLPSEVQTSIRNNGGGVYNHRFYFNGMAPQGERQPIGTLEDAIKKEFGGFEDFKKKFTDAAISVFGSGYAWLINDSQGKLRIITTANQDTPLIMGMCPILNIDVWEHAYYLKHHNLRPDYIEDWFKVVDWNKAEGNYRVCFE